MPNTTGAIITASGRTLEEIEAGIRINMRNHVMSALQIGADLAEAKEACRHGEWMPMLKRLGFSASTAANYMRIAREVDADSRIAQLPYTKILALMAAPAEDREALADAADEMSAAEIRRLTEERNKAAEAANAETVRADAAEEQLRRSEEDAKEIYDKNASLRVELQNLRVKLEKEYSERHRNEMALLSTTERLKKERSELESKLDEKEQEMQQMLRQCDEEAREEEREKLREEIEELKQLLEHEKKKLEFAENSRIEVEKIPEDYAELKSRQEELLEAAADAEARAANAEAELEFLRAGGAGAPDPVWKVLKIAVTRFMTDCEMMPLDPGALMADRARIEAGITRIEGWTKMMRNAMNTAVDAEGAVV